MKKNFIKYLILVAFLFSGITLSGGGGSNSKSSIKWVGTWATSPQLVEPNNMPPDPGLNNNTLRQVVRVSIGGDLIRVRFSNEFSKSPVTLKSVKIAASKGGSSIDSSTVAGLKFNNNAEVTIKPGDVITSDPLSFHLKPRMDVAITIYLGQTSPDVTGHPGSRTTSYLLSGNDTSVNNFTDAVTTDHWYLINGIDVKVSKSAAAVVVLGNSITDGRGSGTNKQNRWTDILSERLVKNKATQNIAVLNEGIGGNCVLKNCLGQAAIDRFDRDVLQQQGVHWVIILEGVNDLGGIRDSSAAFQVAENLTAAYKKMIDKAHEKGIRAYGATILPFGKSFYDKDYREKARTKVNDWIRNSKSFDAVIDFDKIMQNPDNKTTLLPTAHTGDFLHPNEAGYKMMGDAIDLKLFK